MKILLEQDPIHSIPDRQVHSQAPELPVALTDGGWGRQG